MSEQSMTRRERLGLFINHRRVGNTILVLILINGVVLGLQTSRSIEARYGTVMDLINQAILGVFVVELILKFIAFRGGFFRSGWNIFDLVIVSISLIPASDGLEVLRALRVLRLLRLVSQVPKLREIVESIGRSLSGLFWTAALLLLVFYIFGVMGTMLFRDLNPEYFGTLGRTILSLFQVMTLDNWSVIARTIIAEMPWAWVFFVPFILIASFMVLNLFIAVIVNATNSISRDEDTAHQKHVVDQLQALREEIAALAATRTPPAGATSSEPKTPVDPASATAEAAAPPSMETPTPATPGDQGTTTHP